MAGGEQPKSGDCSALLLSVAGAIGCCSRLLTVRYDPVPAIAIPARNEHAIKGCLSHLNAARSRAPIFCIPFNLIRLRVECFRRP